MQIILSRRRFSASGKRAIGWPNPTGVEMVLAAGMTHKPGNCFLSLRPLQDVLERLPLLVHGDVSPHAMIPQGLDHIPRANTGDVSRLVQGDLAVAVEVDGVLGRAQGDQLTECRRLVEPLATRPVSNRLEE